ncbi:MAG: glycosyltransferase family 2 protein [bacterium]
MSLNLTESVTLCLINHNGLAHLQEAFSAWDALVTVFDEILVIDNASTDGSLAFLNSRKDVTVIALSRNTGPAGARNIGFEKARNEIILFQDNDICLTSGAPENLHAVLKQEQGVLLSAPRVVYKSHPDTIQYESADCHLLGMMSLRQANKKCDQAPLTTIRTTSLVTACFMIDRRRWKYGALFDEGLIFNLEDHDLGVRANLLGLKIMAVPEALVRHGKGTEGLSYRPGNKVAATRIYCLIRNRWWIILRYFSLRTLIVLAPILFAFELFQLAGLCFKGWGREWLLALADTLKNFSRLYGERKVYQQQRQRADRFILRGGGLPLTVAMNSNIAMRGIVRLFEFVMHLYWVLAKKLL